MTNPDRAMTEGAVGRLKCPECFATSDVVPVQLRAGRGEPWVDSTLRRCANDDCMKMREGSTEDRVAHLREVYSYKYFGDYELSPEQAQAVWDAYSLAQKVPELEASLSDAERKRDAHKFRADNHRDTLRSIRDMDPETEGDRMRQWASDGLAGYTERAETTLKKEMDRARLAEARAEQYRFLLALMAACAEGAISGLQRDAVEQRMRAMTAEMELVRVKRASSPMAGTDPTSRRDAAKKLLCDICSCAAETGDTTLNQPHVIEDCVRPLETLIWERDACLYLSQQAAKYAGRDGHDILDAIAEKAKAEARATSAEARLAEAVAALKPFVEATKPMDAGWDDETKITLSLPTTRRSGIPTTWVYVEAIYRARAFLSRQEGEREA